MFNSTIISTKRQPDKAKNPVNSHCRQAKLSNEKNLKEKLYRPLTIMDTLDRVRLFKFETENHTRQNIFFFLFFFLRWHDLLQKKKHFAIIIIITAGCFHPFTVKKSTNQFWSFCFIVSHAKRRSHIVLVFSSSCPIFFWWNFPFFWIQNSKYSKCFEFKILDGTVSVVSNHFSNLD